MNHCHIYVDEYMKDAKILTLLHKSGKAIDELLSC